MNVLLICSPYIAPSLRARFDDVLQHNISTFLPPQHHINAEYPLPFVVFRIIQTSDVDVTTVVCLFVGVFVRLSSFGGRECCKIDYVKAI